MIDDHAHPFPLTPTPFDPASLSLDVAPGEGAAARRDALAPTRLATERLSVRLARHLGCSVEELPAARAAAATDWPRYVSGLFADAGLTGMLLDLAGAPLPSAGLAAYGEVGGVAVWELARLEPLVDGLIDARAGPGEILAAADEFLAAAVGRGAVGVKTVLAYRTGLAVDPEVGPAEAERSLREEAPVRRRGKAMRDLLFRHLLGRCADLGLPVQVHTGFGDSEIRLAESHPLLLEDVLRTPEGSAAKVVLIHGAFPWHEEVAYLASVRPSVWAELSLVNLFSPATTADRLLRLLDLAPAGRLLVGTDGHGAPETHWFAAVVLREAWAAVRDRLAPQVRASWLDDIGHLLMEHNARQLYRLDSAPAPAGTR